MKEGLGLSLIHIYVADFYQIRPCDGERVEGIHLFLGEPHAWTVLQASLNDIAAQTNSTLLGKRLELLKLFFRTSVGVDFRRRFPYVFLLSHLSLSLIKMG